MTNDLGLVPLSNFAEVDNGIYRSAQPEYRYQFQWIKNVLGIDTIVNLRSELHLDDKVNEALNLGIEVIDFNVSDHHVPSLEDAHRFIELIQQSIANGKKVLFHCLHGHGRTSTFCVLVRIAQGWNLNDALTEQEQRFHFSFKHQEQKDFLITNFSQVN